MRARNTALVTLEGSRKVGLHSAAKRLVSYDHRVVNQVGPSAAQRKHLLSLDYLILLQSMDNNGQSFVDFSTVYAP